MILYPISSLPQTGAIFLGVQAAEALRLQEAGQALATFVSDYRTRGRKFVKATDKVEIGATGLQVTRLGLGGVALSGAPPATDPDQNTPEMEATHLIHP